MGRKIPGRKHRGVKDPEKQREDRWNIIKDKVNAPPSNPDDQHVPKTLARIMELKDKVKTGLYNKRKKIKSAKPKETYADNSEFKQRPGETDKGFIYRVNKVCEQVTKEAAFQDKYGVEIKRNLETGEVNVVKRPKDEVQLMMKQARKEKKEKKTKKKKKALEDATPKLTKSQKRQQKRQLKRDKKTQENVKDFSNFKDQVKFGEIVHAPPTLKAPRRVEKTGKAPRPGAKTLLLKKLFNNNNEETDSTLRKTTNKTIDKKGKRRDLPNALRRQLDKQQADIIEAYKLLKKKK